MKKAIFALFLACLLAVGGCSCNPYSQLEFSDSNLFQDGKETAVYDVTYNPSFLLDAYSFKKNDALNGIIDYSVNSGTFTVTLQKYSSAEQIFNEVKSQTGFDSDVKNHYDTRENNGFKMTTVLDLNVSYSLNGNTPEIINESVTTSCYFLSLNKNSLAPIYSETDRSYNLLAVANGVASKYPVTAKSTVRYDHSSYLNTVWEKNTENDEFVKVSESKVNYTLKTAIDNSTLLFALRYLNLTKDQSKLIATVTPSYNAITDLTVKYDAETTINTLLGDIPVHRVGFGIANKGFSQLAFIQSGTNSQLEKNNNALVKYVEPISEYGNNYMCLGALEYTLKSLTYN